MKKDAHAARQRRRWNRKPVTVTCGFCGTKIVVPVYRLWVAKQRDNNIYCGSRCRVRGSRLRLGLPADGVCVVAECGKPMSYGGHCEKHAKHRRDAGKAVVAPSRVRVFSYAEYERLRTRVVKTKRREASS